MKCRGILTIVGCLVAGTVLADKTWPGTAGGDIDVEANWGGALPSSSEMAFFSTVQTAPFTLHGDSMTFYNMKLDAPGTNVFDLGAGKTALVSNRMFFKGHTTLHLKSGTMGCTTSGNRIFIGDDQNNNGLLYGGNTLIVDGPNSVFQSAGTSSAGSANSQFIGLGINNANNTILVRNGGTLNGEMRIGSNQKFSSNNVFRVIGSGSSFATVGSNRRFEIGSCGGWNLSEFLDGASMSVDGAVNVGAYQQINNESAKGYWHGPFNTLRLSGAGTSGTVGGIVQVGLGSSSNRIEVVDGATLTFLGSLYVGWLGSNASAYPSSLSADPCGNVFLVGHGSSVRQGVENQSKSINFVIGDAEGATGNVIKVCGSYALDAARTSNYIGTSGANSCFDIDGGTVAITNSGNVIIGRLESAVCSCLRIYNSGCWEHCSTNGNYWLYCGYDAPGCGIAVDGATLRQVPCQGVVNSAGIGLGCSLSASNCWMTCVNGGLVDVERIVVGDKSPNCSLAVTNASVRLSVSLDVGYSAMGSGSCPSNCIVRLSGTNSTIMVQGNFRFKANSRLVYSFPADGNITSPVITCNALETTGGNGLSIAVEIDRGVCRHKRTVELIRTTSTAIGDTTYNRISFDVPEGVTIERTSNAIVARISSRRGAVVSFR